MWWMRMTRIFSKGVEGVGSFSMDETWDRHGVLVVKIFFPSLCV